MKDIDFRMFWEHFSLIVESCTILPDKPPTVLGEVSGKWSVISSNEIFFPILGNCTPLFSKMGKISHLEEWTGYFLLLFSVHADHRTQSKTSHHLSTYQTYTTHTIFKDGLLLKCPPICTSWGMITPFSGYFSFEDPFSIKNSISPFTGTLFSKKKYA